MTDREDFRLRVAHLVPALFGPAGTLGGAERYALELARHMAERVPTELVTFGPADGLERHGALRVRVLGRPWHVRGQETNPWSFRLPGALRPASVVHCHQTHVLASSLTSLWGRLTGRRVVTTDLGGGGWDLSAYVRTDSWFDAHLHLSRYSRRVFGHAELRTAHVIHGGVDASRFSPDPAVARTRSVLFVGRVLPHKGLDDLIRAMPDDVPLDIVGPQPIASYVDDLRNLSAGKRVRFRGACSDDELVRVYREAGCVVLPSVYRSMYGAETSVPELLGQSLLEAMACEAPVVCTDVASLPEIVDHGVHGLVVPPNDPPRLREAILQLLSNPAAAAGIGRLGRRRVLEQFSWTRVVEDCLAIYAAVVDGRPAGTGRSVPT